MPTSRDAPTDEELLKLIEEAEAAEQLLAQLEGRDAGEAEEDEGEAPEVAGDPCPHCGVPALALEWCAVCETEGCMPRDDWAPGMEDPCMTRCVRCAMLVHVDCASDDFTGNPLCYTCRPA